MLDYLTFEEALNSLAYRSEPMDEYNAIIVKDRTNALIKKIDEILSEV